ncbi:MAG TPA: efflux RND transporter periplasmic adaptor subunit, partial [Steroidobacteraceae bacterium]|nr:efflux RND transporter periplasmic adaptor subunit [Steroidobacteraceae bacterium]
MALNQDALNSLRIERSDEPSPSSGSRNRIVMLVIIVVAAVALGAWWYSSTRATEVEIIEVQATRSSGNSAASVLDASGYVVARRIATVSAKAMGQVEEVLIDTGDRVKQGQVLARLDPSTVRKQFELSNQQLEATRAQLADVHARLINAQRSAKRADQLRADKLISEAEYDTALANLASLEAQYSAAEHQVAASESSMKVQRQSLTDLEVRAPFAGVIVAKAAQPGEIISPMSAGGFTRTGIATIVDMDSLEIEV